MSRGLIGFVGSGGGGAGSSEDIDVIDFEGSSLYNADGTGATSARVALQEALDDTKGVAAALDTKVTLRLGRGKKYLIDSAGTVAINYLGGNTTQPYCLKIGSGVRLDLNGSILKLADSANSSIFVNDGVLYTDPRDSLIEITNGIIEGNEANQGVAGGSAVMAAIVLMHVDGLTVTDLVFNDVRDGATRFWDITGFYYNNLECNRSDGDAFHLGTHDPAGTFDARIRNGTIGVLRANNCKVGLYGSRQGNPVILSAVNSALGTWIADTCAGGYKVQDGSTDVTGESALFIGATAKNANNSSTNSGMKIQGSATAPCVRVSWTSVHSKGCEGQGLYIENADDITVGTYAGNSNAVAGTVPDVRIGTGKGRQIGTIASEDSGQVGVVVRADSEDTQIGQITVTNPSQVSASAAGVQVLNTVGSTQIDHVMARDTRGTPKMTYGLDVPTAGTRGHCNSADVIGALTKPIRVLSEAFTLGSIDSEIRPIEHQLVAWVYDPVAATGATQLTSGVLYLLKVRIPTPQTITNIITLITTAGATLTAGQNFAALFNSAGTQVGITADQAASWVSTGIKTMALVTPYVAPAGHYYIAILTNGTTAPFLARSINTAIANANLPTGSFRFATIGTGQTAVPASFTPASQVGLSTAFWAAVS